MANTQRYWDGDRWTEHVQPVVTPTTATAVYPSQPSQEEGPQAKQQPPAASTQLQDPIQPHYQPQYQQPQSQQPQYVIVQQKSGMSTTAKVLLALTGLFLLMVAGCTALVVAVGSGEAISTEVVEDPRDFEIPEPDAPPDSAPGTTAAFDGENESSPTTPAAPPQRTGLREAPFEYGDTINLTWTTFGDADGSMWATRVGPPRDITDEVLANDQFNNGPPDGVRYVGFDAELTLLAASKEPLSPGFNFTWELIGGATDGVYRVNTVETDSFGCGAVSGSFDHFAEVFTEGTLSGTICIPIPEEDLNDPSTQIALHFADDTRAHFGN